MLPAVSGPADRIAEREAGSPQANPGKFSSNCFKRERLPCAIGNIPEIISDRGAQPGYVCGGYGKRVVCSTIESKA